MDKETYTFEDRVYVNPEVSRDEQLGFIDKLRSIQQEGAEKIARDTHNLGTDVTPNLGGLNGAESIWSAQYVTPKVESMASSLRTAAQAQALNDVLSNYQEQMKKRYNDAYSAAQRRAGGGGSGGDGGPGNNGNVEGDIDWKSSTKKDASDGFWKDSSIGKDKAFYGLYQLNRNSGESEDDWKNRAEAWIRQKSAEHHLNNGEWPVNNNGGKKTRPSSGNPLLDALYQQSIIFG